MQNFSEINQHLLRFSPDALIVADRSGRICFANETVTELFGYAPTTLLGRNIETLIPERLHQRHAGHTAGYMKDPRNREMGARSTDLFARRADGSEFPAGIRLAPFRVGDSQYVVAAIRDNTERQQINEALIVAREEAERAGRAKSRFLATASHDLRQPLQTIRLLNAAMLKLAADAKTVELLRCQEQAIGSMSSMLNALLDISRLESGAVEPQRSDVQLAEIFAELKTEFETVAHAQGLNLDVTDASFVVHTDRVLLYQLLQNLVGNALKYTDQGSVKIACVIEGDSLVLSVKDTGIGIPPDKLDRIFDEYYQVDTHGAKRMGVGLGLAIVKEVARLLDFSVRILSEVGTGTEGRIIIPKMYWQVAVDNKAVAVATVEEGSPVHKSRLILVEDNEGVRLATELYLKLEGYEVLTASTIDAALAFLPQIRNSDIVIADYHLDEKNTGLDFLLRIRQQLGYEIPGVILSGDLPSVLRTLSVPVLNSRFLSKPVDIRLLLDSIEELSRLTGGKN